MDKTWFFTAKNVITICIAYCKNLLCFCIAINRYDFSLVGHHYESKNKRGNGWKMLRHEKYYNYWAISKLVTISGSRIQVGLQYNQRHVQCHRWNPRLINPRSSSRSVINLGFRRWSRLREAVDLLPHNLYQCHVHSRNRKSFPTNYSDRNYRKTCYTWSLGRNLFLTNLCRSRDWT